MTTLGKIAATLTAVVALAALTVGGYQLGWWLKEDGANRQTRIDNTRQATQEAWQDQIREAMRDAALLQDGPQRAAVVRLACDLIPDLTDTYFTPDIATFTAQEC